MSKAAVLLAHDARLQYRYGIYVAYAFVVGFYIAALTLGRGILPDWAVAALIYTDPAAVGFFFLGALMMLEKAEGVRAALAISPVTSLHYLIGKLISLTALAVIASAVLLLVHGAAPHPALLIATVTLISLTFIGIGVPVAILFRTVNEYLIGSSAFLTPLIAPAFLALLDPMPAWLAIWPPVAQFRLLLVSLGYAEADDPAIVFMLVVCAAGAVGALWLALASLRRELGK